MRNVTLRHAQSMTHQTGDQIAVAVVADDEIWDFTVTGLVQLCLDSFGCVLSKPL